MKTLYAIILSCLIFSTALLAGNITITSPSSVIYAAPGETSLNTWFNIGGSGSGYPYINIYKFVVKLDGNTIFNSPDYYPQFYSTVAGISSHTVFVEMWEDNYLGQHVLTTTKTQQFTLQATVSITAQNNFPGGTIYVGDETSLPEVSSPNTFPKIVGANVMLKAKSQNDDQNYNRIWNNFAPNNTSKWQFNDADIINSGTIEYSFTAAQSDNNGTYKAGLRRNYSIARNDQTDFDGTVLVNNVTHIVDQNSGVVPAPSTRTIGNNLYNFIGWANGANGQMTPTDNQTYPNNALYKGHFLTNNNASFATNGSHKFIRTTDGTLHLVYNSMYNWQHKVFYETSSDNGSTWQLRYSDLGWGPVIAVVNNNRVVFAYLYGSGIIKAVCYDVSSQSVLSTSSLLGQVPYDSPDELAIAITTGGKIALTYYNGFEDDYNIPGYYAISGAVASNGTLSWGYSPSYEYGGLTYSSARNVALEVRDNSGEGLFHFAFDDDDGYGGRQIYYGPLIRDSYYVSQYVYSPYNNCLSSASGLQSSTNPSLIPMANEASRFTWIGDDGAGEVMSIFKDPGYWRYWNFGLDVTSTSINQASNGGYVIDWSDGSTQSYTNSSTLYTLGTISSTGKYVQIGNHSTMASMKAMGFDESNLPYRFNLSTPIGSEQLQKGSSNEIAIRGRGGVISIQKLINPNIKLDSTRLKRPNVKQMQFAFSVNNVSVDGNPINFIDLPDSVNGSDLKTLNQYLITEPFALNDNSTFIYDISSTVANSNKISEMLDEGKFINFKVELVDVETQRVLGVSNEVNQTRKQVFASQKSGFGIDCKGIGNKKAVLRIVVNTNADAKFAITEKVMKASEVLKKQSQQRTVISYQGQSVVANFALEQNYPNPFNPTTTINYALPKAGNVVLKVYDVLGKEVATLVNDYKGMGRYSVAFDASKLSTGMYVYKLTSDKFTEVKKMMLVK